MNDPPVSTSASSEISENQKWIGLPARRKRHPVGHRRTRQSPGRPQIGRDFCSRCAPSPEKTGVADEKSQKTPRKTVYEPLPPLREVYYRTGRIRGDTMANQMSKSQLVERIATATELSKRDDKHVMDTLT